MRIFITGGCGFIGSHVADLCLSMDHEICVIDNLSTGRIENISIVGTHDGGLYITEKPGVPWADAFYEIDIADLPWIKRKFETWKPDVIIHLAAQPSLQESIKNPIKDAQINYLGTINLVRLALGYGVNRIVFASTSAVYAPRISGVYPEDSTIGPKTPYGISKWAAEQFIRNSGLSYAILRLGNVYGPRQVPLGENQLIPRALAHIYQGEPFVINGDGTHKRDFVYVKDVARAFLLASKKEANGTFNISSGVSYSVNEILESILWASEKEMEFDHGPDKPGELDHIKLVVQRAYYKLKWRSETHISDGMVKTVEAWPKEK